MHMSNSPNNYSFIIKCIQNLIWELGNVGFVNSIGFDQKPTWILSDFSNLVYHDPFETNAKAF